MFPNPYNIYLHDTPSKSLFDKEVRAYSHGCIRVADPFDLAHALLSVQSTDAEAEFDAKLKTGNETTVKLMQPVPVHLVYFTAYPGREGPHQLSPRHLWPRRGAFRRAERCRGGTGGRSAVNLRQAEPARRDLRTAWPTRSAISQRPLAPRPRAILT